MQILEKYFKLSKTQKQQFLLLEKECKYWNTQINIISRKDIHKLYQNHILHSLAISKIIQFKANSKVLDAGTGGGFPGIPLAILFPKVNFFLVDSIKKKIKVVNEIYKSIGLKNIQTSHSRIEDLNDSFDFIVSRAVAKMSTFNNLVVGKLSNKNFNNFNNGIFCLKGGDLSNELKGINHKLFEISDFFNEDYFITKKIIYINYKNLI
ncbi:MAG: 16S rRNA (guanine(527)-N(7))-methyltransferase RsmG [Flavobacteriales bacterium]|nr:16S rRNA (guanine(527)-N(7))-methyltransferase RsmG [Flavobacteriales bacterium]